MEAKWNKYRFVIEKDVPELGYYLTVYSGGRSIADYLQDTEKICMEIAKEMYGVPESAWD